MTLPNAAEGGWTAGPLSVHQRDATQFISANMDEQGEPREGERKNEGFWTARCNGPDALANAYLYAAAPDLFAACAAAEDFCAAEPGDPAYSIYRQLHAALAKARGQ